METNRTKWVRIGDGPSVTVMEAVPSFVAKKSLRIDEDPSPFYSDMELQRKDTIAGNSEAAAVCSENVVTLHDRAMASVRFLTHAFCISL